MVCYCDSACGWDGLVETCCNSVVDVVECLVLNPCCVVMYGRITFSSVLQIGGILVCMMSQC